MNSLLFDTSKLTHIRRNPETTIKYETDAASISPRRRGLVPPRKNPHFLTHHQFAISAEDLFSICIYDKDFALEGRVGTGTMLPERGIYIHTILVNIPGKMFEKSDSLSTSEYVFKFEKIEAENNHRYNIDIHRQHSRINDVASTRTNYPDKKRLAFPIDKFMNILQCELVSRQEFKNPHLGGLSLFLGGPTLSSTNLSTHLV